MRIMLNSTLINLLSNVTINEAVSYLKGNNGLSFIDKIKNNIINEEIDLKVESLDMRWYLNSLILYMTLAEKFIQDSKKYPSKENDMDALRHFKDFLQAKEKLLDSEKMSKKDKAIMSSFIVSTCAVVLSAIVISATGVLAIKLVIIVMMIAAVLLAGIFMAAKITFDESKVERLENKKTILSTLDSEQSAIPDNYKVSTLGYFRTPQLESEDPSFDLELTP